MLQNAYFLAKIGADTAENERKFAEKFAKNWQLPYGSQLPFGAGGSTGSEAGRSGSRPGRKTLHHSRLALRQAASRAWAQNKESSRSTTSNIKYDQNIFFELL